MQDPKAHPLWCKHVNKLGIYFAVTFWNISTLFSCSYFLTINSKFLWFIVRRVRCVSVCEQTSFSVMILLLLTNQARGMNSGGELKLVVFPLWNHLGNMIPFSVHPILYVEFKVFLGHRVSYLDRWDKVSPSQYIVLLDWHIVGREIVRLCPPHSLFSILCGVYSLFTCMRDRKGRANFFHTANCWLEQKEFSGLKAYVIMNLKCRVRSARGPSNWVHLVWKRSCHAQNRKNIS